MKAASKRRRTGVKMLVVRAPAVVLLLGWLGFPDGGAASEVRVSRWFSPRLAITGENFPQPIVAVGPGMSNAELAMSHAVLSPESRSDLQSSTTHLVAAEKSDATQPAETPPGAKVTRDQAIAIAVKAVPGKANKVEVEEKLGKLVYVVEVMTPKGDETDVFVDVASGDVVGTDR